MEEGGGSNERGKVSGFGSLKEEQNVGEEVVKDEENGRRGREKRGKKRETTRDEGREETKQRGREKNKVQSGGNRIRVSVVLRNGNLSSLRRVSVKF